MASLPHPSGRVESMAFRIFDTLLADGMPKSKPLLPGCEDRGLTYFKSLLQLQTTPDIARRIFAKLAGTTLP